MKEINQVIESFSAFVSSFGHSVWYTQGHDVTMIDSSTNKN